MVISRISLKIGHWGNLQGTRYQIIGAGVWRAEYQEYYSNADGKGYETAFWRYTEWVLRSAEGNLAYLIEDDKGFSMSQSIDPPYKVIPLAEPDQFTDFYDNAPNHRIIEYGKAELVTFEGENGFREAEPKYKIFWAYANNGAIYSLEIPVTSHGNPQNEGAYYINTSCRRQEILAAFAENRAIKTLSKWRANARLATMFARVWAWLAFVLFIYSFFSYKLIFEHTFFRKELPGDTLVELLSPDWEIKEPNGIYLVETEATFASMLVGKNPCEMYVQTAVAEETEGVLDVVGKDFWEEYGYDSEGAWHESSRYASMYVRANQKGKYLAWVMVERSPAMVDWGADIEVRVYKYEFLWWYTMLFWLLALLVRAVLGSYTKD